MDLIISKQEIKKNEIDEIKEIESSSEEKSILKEINRKLDLLLERNKEDE